MKLYLLKKLNPGSVKTRLIATFLAVLLIPALSTGIFSYHSSQKELSSHMSSSTQETVDLASEIIGQYIRPVMSEADFLADQLSASGVERNDPAIRKLIDLFMSKHSELELVTLGNENGAWMKAPDPGAQDYDPRKRDWYIETLKNPGKVVLSAPYISATTKNMVVTISKTFPDGKGVIGLNLDLAKLSSVLQQVKIGDKGYVYVLDQGSKYLSHPTVKPGEQASGSQVDAMQQNSSGIVNYVKEGVEKEAHFVTNEITGWKIAGTIEMDEYSDAAKPILYQTVIVIIAALIVAGILIYLIMRAIIVPLNALRVGTGSIQSGDLTCRVNILRNDEFGGLANDFNAMADSLHSLVREINDTSLQLAASSQEMKAVTEQTTQTVGHVTQSIQHVAAAEEMQSQTTGETARAMEEMAVGVGRIAESAGTIVQSAMQTEAEVENGNSTVEQVTRQMEEILGSVSESSEMIRKLSELSTQIRDMNTAIAEIAGQTNLLSLNAAIEAARAGENGRGFAVVAGEIRKLAEQSKTTADHIHGVISQMLHMIESIADVMNHRVNAEVDKGIHITEKARAAFVQIQSSTKHIVHQIHDISAVAEQMSASSEEVAAAVEEMAVSSKSSVQYTQNVLSSSQEQLASMEEITSTAESLTVLAEQLQKAVERFKV
ncbi:methyl-accepting chemotaxis protein [Paenibacillus allorhizosphaerae]|uniref:Methyl-accepting chemotaxis protein McpA n=1 Tax=Paenibacillus allorhizosphaerae TaxID=2849866 RepID=A0ABN7TR47_9BACL|nr:methyl-accepting chemotaxis protein [Paenibacillus allorhizosphaerae]CAG7652335.1 Methyl-accepting chemotaxis protein McpA [Paenibacillus allorhizosphaerae]